MKSCLNHAFPKIEDFKLNQTCDFLPKPQVQASQLRLHISYLLQKCNKANPLNGFALIEKRYHNTGYGPDTGKQSQV